MKVEIKGERLKELRKNKKISQDKLGYLCQVSKSILCRIESDKYNMINEESFSLICKYLDCSRDYLNGKSTQNKKYSGDMEQQLNSDLLKNIEQLIHSSSFGDKLNLNHILLSMMNSKRVYFRKVTKLKDEIIISRL